MNKANPTPISDYILSKASALKIPLSGTFELTPMCNFSCRMCYVVKTASEVKRHGRPMQKTKEWLDLAGQAYDQGLLNLLLTGGEPLSRKDFWTLYHEIVRMGILTSVNTNGSLIDGKAIERFLKDPPKRLNITLYGCSRDTYGKLCRNPGAFDKVDFAIRHLVEAGIQVKLNCSLTPHNACDLERMIRYAEDRGVLLDVVTYMFPPIRRNPSMIGQNDRFTPQESAGYRLLAYKLQHGEQRYRQYLESIVRGEIEPLGLDESCVDPLDGKIKCRAGKACFWVTWDGWLTPCGMMSVPKVDLNENTFSEAWMQVADLSDRLLLSGICNQCKSSLLCHTCAAVALTETGLVSGVPTYLCNTVAEMRKIAVTEL